jgi:hypothetical protein
MMTGAGTKTRDRVVLFRTSSPGDLVGISGVLTPEVIVAMTGI